MIEIKLTYKPFRLLKTIREINGQFPSEFEELKPEQLVAISKVINETISDIDFLQIMTGIKKNRIKKLDQYQQYKLIQLFMPLTEIKPYHDFIIPFICSGSIQYFAPGAKLFDITFGQFIFVESYFANYQTDKSKPDLHKFVASLYLQESTPFEEKAIKTDMVPIGKIDENVLEAISLNYIFIKEWLALAYPLLLSQAKAQEEKSENPKRINNSSWVKVFESVVGDDIINQDKYANLPIHTVFRWMTNKIKENMKRK